MRWYLKVFRDYRDFSGRSRRKEFWLFVLVNVIVGLILSLADVMAGFSDDFGDVGPLGGLYGLLAIIPYLAVLVRRLHDIGWSGWWALAMLVPLLNLFVLVLTVFNGQPGPNRFGPDPKAAT
ncbi:MAG: DUF805 domain-containing protein [Geminicoccaceae bacterium]